MGVHLGGMAPALLRLEMPPGETGPYWKKRDEQLIGESIIGDSWTDSDWADFAEDHVVFVPRWRSVGGGIITPHLVAVPRCAVRRGDEAGREVSEARREVVAHAGWEMRHALARVAQSVIGDADLARQFWALPATEVLSLLKDRLTVFRAEKVAENFPGCPIFSGELSDASTSRFYGLVASSDKLEVTRAIGVQAEQRRIEERDAKLLAEFYGEAGEPRLGDVDEVEQPWRLCESVQSLPTRPTPGLFAEAAAEDGQDNSVLTGESAARPLSQRAARRLRSRAKKARRQGREKDAEGELRWPFL